MTFDAVCEVSDSLFAMLLFYRGRIVLMAVIARVYGVARFVTGLAGQLTSSAVVQEERVAA